MASPRLQSATLEKRLTELKIPAQLPKREHARRPSKPRLLSAHNTQHSGKARQSSNLCSITKTQTTQEAFNAFQALRMQKPKRPECNINHETLRQATYP